MLRLFSIVLLVVGLAFSVGCANTDVYVLYKNEAAKAIIDTQKIYTEDELENTDYIALGIITALSCNDGKILRDSTSTNKDCINQMLYKAGNLKADGIMNVYCEPRSSKPTLRCWDTIRCSSVAIKLKK